MRINRASLLHGAALGLVLADGAHAHRHLREIDGLRLITDAANEPAADALGQGRGLFAAGDVPGALAAFRRAAVASPRSTDALLGVAACYDAFGRPDVARAFYEAALALDPASPEIAAAFGRSLASAGEAAARARSVGPRAEVAHAWVPAAPVARIEQTSEGEQRLVLGAPPPAPEIAATLGDDAAVVAVAPRWTERDEVALIGRETSAMQAEASAALLRAEAATRTRAGSATPADVRPPADPGPMLAAAALPAGGIRWSAEVPSVGGLPRAALSAARSGAALHAAIPSDLALAQSVMANAPTLRRHAPGLGQALAVAGERPVVKPLSSVFDSDDGVLNAFASRLRSRSADPAAPELSTRAAATARAALARLDRFAARPANG